MKLIHIEDFLITNGDINESCECEDLKVMKVLPEQMTSSESECELECNDFGTKFMGYVNNDCLE